MAENNETNWVSLQSHSNDPQSVFDETTQRKWILDPKAVIAFPERIAKLFLRERAQWVNIYQPPVIPDVPGEDSIWMANATGNPFLPATVKNRKGADVANPNIAPQVLTRKMSTSQKSENGSDGFLVVRNFPPITITIAPYTRFRCPISVANWLEQRDAQQEPEGVGKIIRARGPEGFEPNETWSLDEIRVYATLVDEHGFDVEKEFPQEKALTNPTAVEEVKAKLLKRLFFRVIDPSWALPSKAFFDKEFVRLMKPQKSSQAKDIKVIQPSA